MTMLLLFLLFVVPLTGHAGGGRADCLVEGTATPEMEHRALAACHQARHRIKVLFEVEAAHVRLIFAETFEYDRLVSVDTVTQFVPPKGGLTTDAGTFSNWESSAAHEIAHGLYNARRGLIHSYGENRGDWFMEAVAIWAETEQERADRVRRAYEVDRHALELAELLRMHHPLHLGGSPPRGIERIQSSICRGPCPGRPDTLHIRRVSLPDGTETVDTLPSDSPILRRAKIGGAFYTLAFSVLEFIHERGGPPAVVMLEQRVKEGLGADAVLGLPGVPEQFEQFEQEWSAWLAEAAKRELPPPPARPGRL